MPGAQVVRAEGRAPIRDGRVDLAFQQALEEAFRGGVLDALRAIAPERQSPRDLEIWQESVLSRAQDFVGAWRILSQEEQGGFVVLEAELEIWRDKLARAARAPGAAAASAPVRLLVLADAFAITDPAGDEEVDAGRHAAAALEAELARRGAVIVSTTDRTPWGSGPGAAAEENRVALAAAAAKRLDADAVLLARLSRRGAGLTLAAQLIAVTSESTLAAARVDVELTGATPLTESFLSPARQIAGVLAPRLARARAGRARPGTPERP